MAKATTRNATPKVIVGKKVPDFTATDTDGGHWRLKDQAGSCISTLVSSTNSRRCRALRRRVKTLSPPPRPPPRGRRL